MSGPRVIHREVTGRREDYLRGMAGAFPGQVDAAREPHRLSTADATIELAIAAAPPLRIASLEMPAINVTIRFVEGSDSACTALLAHLDRYLHRGGG